MRRGIAAFAAVIVCWTVAVACGSVPDVKFGTDEGGVTPPPNPLDGQTLDTGMDTFVPIDGCTPSGAEVCDDGIDNNCDGHTDCDDQACMPTFMCVDIPAGWTYVPFAESMRPSCPLGDTAMDLKVVAGDGTVTCTCSCNGVGGTGASCNAGSFTVTSSNEGTCSVSTSTTTVGVNAAMCTLMGTPINVGTFIEATPPAGPASCGATTNSPPPVTDGRACALPRMGKGCAGTQVCVPKGTAPLTQCVQKSGVNACPTVFTKGHLAGSSVTGTDTRACTGCTCANPPAPCTGGSVSVYDNNMCQTNGAMKKGAEGITSTCAGASPSASFTAGTMYFKSTPPTAGGCNATPTAPASFTGSLTLADEITVCCK